MTRAIFVQTPVPSRRAARVALGAAALAMMVALPACGGKNRGNIARTQATQINTIGVNAYLWRAALETASFAPLLSADSSGGVIITDWYVNPTNPGERVKLTIAILDQDLGSEDAQIVLADLLSHSDGLPVVMMCSNMAEARLAQAQGKLRAALPKPLLWRDLVAAIDGREPLVPQPDAPPAGRAKPDPGTQRVQVLYAEDNKTNQLVFRKMIQSLPVDLHLAENGRRAVEMFAQLRPDMIFMDVSMPQMDGREATALIRATAEGREVPIIALTAHAMQDEIDRIMGAGMNAMLTKPLKKAELLRALRDHAPAGVFGDDTIAPDPLSDNTGIAD
ncbi:MAG: DUF3576 domain-containing protein [Roseinatronobacter sp.]